MTILTKTLGGCDLIDTHCHLPEAAFDADRAAVLARAADAGIAGMLAAATSPEDWQAYLELAAGHSPIRLALGFHPNSAQAFSAAALGTLRELLSAHRGVVVAVGESGLDFYRDHCPPEVQRAALRGQLDLAAELNMPIILHCRQAEGELLETLAAHRARTGRAVKGVWHSFSAAPEEAREAVKLGLHLGLNGIVTYPKAEGVREAARQAPADRLLLETDAPYLPPQPWRGKRNEPAYLAEVARRVAEALGKPPAEVARRTTENARRLFGAWREAHGED
jgi:TatD DNase family protein